MARVLLWDCETTALVTRNWTRWDEGVIRVVEPSYMLCFAYKWLGDKRTQVVGLPDFKTYKKQPKNDLELIKRLRELFSEADIVIAHNGNSFDQKVAQARMVHHRLGPPAPYKQIDTKLLAKRYFRFDSNKLDELGKYLDLGQKLSTGGFELWEGCEAGDMKAWKKMMRYNKQDVVLLEQVYLRLRPWMSGHPSISMFDGRPQACPSCGSGPLHNKGKQVSSTNTYNRYQCQACGSYHRSRVADKLNKDERTMYV